MEGEQEARVFVASQWQLIWWRFRRHKVAFSSGIIILIIYLVALFPEFLAPFPPDITSAKYLYGPPQRLHLLDRGTDGKLRVDPYVYALKSTIEPKAMRRVFSVDTQQKIRVRFFVQGEPYKLLGLFPATVRLIGPVDKTQPMYLLGADRLGRDALSRMIHGARVSMSIGLVGVILSLFFGILLGGISGYYGGMVDNAIQRIIEFLRSIPTIPLWMGLAAALPMDWPPLRVYLGITVILSFVGWTGLARVVRGRFLSLREEEFIMAAEVDGASELRIILRYMLPSFMSHIIASTTLAIPGMILAETSLSFLGLGLRPPIISWGVLLKEAQTVRVVIQAPWLLWPAVPVVISVLALNFLGDGLRDAADPYAR
ncbi:MAG TPA: ABC transporter permease [Anaerolineae bacterium]|nr:ABC transporter permease [Anaerolineae bacterium]